MKRILSILLAVMLLTVFLPLSAFAEEESKENQGNFNPANTNSPLEVMEGSDESAGALITTVAPVEYIGIGCPSWSDNHGSLTITLYKWDTNYEKTVSADPIKTARFDDYADNSMLGFDLDPVLEPGSYYIEASDGYDTGGSKVGVWTGAAWPGQAVFVNGLYDARKSLRLQVTYTTEVEGEVYGELPTFEKPKPPVGGDGMLPSPDYIIMAEDDNADMLVGTGNQIEGSVSEDGNLLLTVLAGAVDSQYPFDFSMVGLSETVSCEQYPIMALSVKIKGNAAAGGGEAFWLTSSMKNAVGSAYFGPIEYDYSSDDWQTIIIDPTTNLVFQNCAQQGDMWYGFRFDVISATPTDEVTCEIRWIAFFENAEAAQAFDGDFSAVAAAKPTEAPKDEKPTEKPADVTEEPAKETEAPAEKTGCGSVITSGMALVAVMTGAVVFLGKKKRR